MPAHAAVIGAGDADHVRQVKLALGVIGVQLGHRRTQQVSVESVHTGINFCKGALVLGRVFFLHNAHDLTVSGPHNASITSGLIDVRGQHRHCRARQSVVLCEESSQCFRVEHGNIGGRHQHSATKIVWQFIQPAGNGMTRAVLFFLNCGCHLSDPIVAQIFLSNSRNDLVSAVADHCNQMLRMHPRRRV